MRKTTKKFGKKNEFGYPVPEMTGRSRFIYFIASVSALGGMLFGYDTGVISGAILFIREDFDLTAGMEEFVVSSVLIGAVLGSIFGGRLSDMFGRRKVLMATSAVFTAGAIFASQAASVENLIIGRIAIGTAIGIASFISPLYISEIAPSEIRGRLVSLNQIAITGGIVVSYFIDFALSGIRGWRWMFGLAAIPAILLGAGMLFLPESPRWFVSKGRVEEAKKAMGRIRGHVEVDNEVSAIKRGLSLQKGGLDEMFKPSTRPALVIGIGLAIFQQVTGINTVIYYAPIIFESAGFVSASSAILATIGIGFVNLALTVVAMLLLDRIGRRPLLLGGLAGMVLSLFVLGLAFMARGNNVSQWLSVLSLVMYVGSFAIGLGPVFWLLISEIYPLKIRGAAMGIATFANWSANLVVAITFITLLQKLGDTVTFWLYSIIGLGALSFAYFLVPETKGKTLEEIESIWKSNRRERT